MADSMANLSGNGSPFSMTDPEKTPQQSEAEIERYARHIVLRGIGGPGQMRLKQARILVIGAGGLGSPLIQYLAASGVGTIGIVDDDHVSLSNLQRQILHGTADIGTLKTASAAKAVKNLNPHVTVETHALRIDEGNARELIKTYDVIADGSDNFDTRYTVSDACYYAKKPLVTASVNEYDGSLTTIRAHEKDKSGQPNPTYRCLFPTKPAANIVPTCAQTGVLGALTGVIGSLQAMEVIREITGFGADGENGSTGLVGRLLLVDALYLRFETMTYVWDPTNPLNGKKA
jgi:molybdopterin-synthase adenylyltransferase